MKLKKFAERYCESHAICKTYQDQLRRSVRCYTEFVGRDRGKFSYKQVNAFLAELQERRSATTVINYRRTLLTLWIYAADTGNCDPPIARRIRRPKSVLQTPKAFSTEEIRRLIDVAGELKGVYPHCTRSAYWQAVIAGGYCTGLRRGDLLLIPRSIESGARFTVVESKTGQTQIRQLSPLAVEFLKAIPTLRSLASRERSTGSFRVPD